MSKGFIRSLEAVIAILLFLTFFYTVFNKSVEPVESLNQIQSSLHAVIGRVLYNETLRSDILNGQYQSLEQLLAEYLPSSYLSTYMVCNQANCISENLPPNKEIFLDDTYITSTYVTQNPKILRIYAWKK